MLYIINRIGDEKLETFSTGDFLIINELYHEMKVEESLKPRLKRLVEIGVVEHVGRNKYVLAQSLYKAIGEAGVYTRIVGLDKDTNKELMLKHIRMNGEKGTPLKELYQVLPGCGRSQIQRMMRELKNEGEIYCKGNTRAALWFASKQYY